VYKFKIKKKKIGLLRFLGLKKRKNLGFF